MAELGESNKDREWLAGMIAAFLSGARGVGVLHMKPWPEVAERLVEWMDDRNLLVSDPNYFRHCDWPDCLRAYDVRTGPKPAVDGHPWIHVRGAHALLCPDHQGLGHRPQRFMWAPGDTTITTSCECGAASGPLSPTTTARCYQWWADHVSAVQHAIAPGLA